MLQAQNSVSGKVTDKDMNPIVGVSVYAPELHKGPPR
jgi:iron complex outermembrane receptor protein